MTTHDNATGGGTGTAAVDQAIADVRAQLNKPWCPNLGSCPPELHSGCSYCAGHEDALAALRVLADAVEDYEAAKREYEKQREYADEQYRKALAAEAERDRLQVALDNGDRLLSQCGRETDRLARQVADLERALRGIAEEPPPQAWADASEIARDALAAARSRDPQEPRDG